MGGNSSSVQTEKQMPRRQHKDRIRHVNPKETKKQVQEKEKLIVGGNPERDIGNYNAGNKFQKEVSTQPISKEGQIQKEATNIKKKQETIMSQKNGQEIRTKEVSKSEEQQDKKKSISPLTQDQQMSASSLLGEKIIVTSKNDQPQNEKYQKEQNLKRTQDLQKQGQGIGQLKNEENLITEQNSTEPIIFGEGIFQIYQGEKPDNIKFQPAKIDFLGSQLPLRKHHHSKGERYQRDIQIRKFSLQEQELPQGDFKKKKNTSISIHSLEEDIITKKPNIQTQMTIADINKLKHFDIPEFIPKDQESLVACKQCGRKFRNTIVQKHELICKLSHKHKIYKSWQHRQISVEEEKLFKKYQNKEKQEMQPQKKKIFKWVEDSWALRNLIKNRPHFKYQTLYEIKENQSAQKQMNDANCQYCGKLIKNVDSQIHPFFCCCMKKEVQKTIQQLKKENTFDVPEYDLNQELVACGLCGRKFNVNRLQKHESVCEDVFQQKRNIFESKNQRMNYEEQVRFSQRNEHEIKDIKKPMTTWRKKSESLRSAIKSNMDANYKTLYEVLDAQSEKYPVMDCKECGKEISKKAIDTHFSFCKSRANKKVYEQEENVFHQ